MEHLEQIAPKPKLKLPLLAAPAAKSDPAKPTPPVNCHIPTSEAERHKCFMDNFDQTVKLGEEVKNKPRAPLPIIDNLREAQAQKERETKQAQEQDTQNKVLAEARKRNVSNKGKKYKITYGRVVEPQR